MTHYVCYLPLALFRYNESGEGVKQINTKNLSIRIETRCSLLYPLQLLGLGGLVQVFFKCEPNYNTYVTI